eukprot:g8165.t1
MTTSSRMEISFESRFRRYIYDFEKGEFHRLSYPVSNSMEWYLHHEGYKTAMAISEAIGRWGPNAFDIPVPKFTALLQQQLLAPFFVFQTFCVGLWCLDEYWMYSVFTLFLLVFFECTVAGQRLRNLQHLRNLQSPGQLTNVFRKGKWERIPAELLLPGDLISISQPPSGHDEIVIPSDCVLLNGTCIVDESVLTGESTPQWKAPLSSGLDDELTNQMELDLKRDKLHVLFGGTKCLQNSVQKTGFHVKTTDGGCVALVIRTGFESAQGNLMGTILHSTEQVSANNWETGVFILFLLSFAVTASGYVLYHGLQDPSRSRFKLFLNCTMIITSVIPPELPMELSIAVNHSLIQLMRKRIFCTEPFRIPFAGAVDVCCFDKTGTLTDDWMTLEGVAATSVGPGSMELIPVKQLPLEISRVLASCHSLTVVNRQLMGDPLERAAFEAIGWSYRSDEAEHPQRQDSVIILHRYHFSAQLKRMAVVIRSRLSSNESFSVVKGAPETMFPRFKDPPMDYHLQYRKFASLGGRIIALGSKALHESDAQEHAAMRGFDRETAETGLSFLGFAVFRCPLKKDSAAALEKLKNSSHELVMITGDAALTACNVAQTVHIITRPVLILMRKTNVELNREDLGEIDFEWVNPEETEHFPFVSNRTQILDLASEWDLCITGDCFGFLERNEMALFLIPLVQVFARVAPEHKATVVDTLRKSGRVVLMCGDGTNDVGALKASHVGVALLTSCKDRSQSTKKDGAKSRSAARKQPALRKLHQGGKPNPAMEYVEELEKQGRSVNPSIRRIAELVEEMNEDPALLKPGDSSMAAPFTSKQASVMPCTDLIMQGRSTLVSTVQMFKILGLMSLANAYALSVMHLQGVKIGDVQVTITGLLSAGMFFFLSNAEPLRSLSKQRPHPSIFCAYVFLSVLGQSIIHMSYLIYLYQSSLELMSDSKEDEESKFQPNLVNSVCFLVNFIIQITTFAVNYSGAPFTTPLMQNRGLIRCLLISGGFALLLAIDILPGFNSLFEMVFIPHSLRAKILSLALLDFLATYALESALKFAFPAPLPPSKESRPSGLVGNKQQKKIV